MNCKTCNDKYFIISNNENWDNEIQKCDECNYFKTDKQAQDWIVNETVPYNDIREANND